jgi:acyl-CoA thioester hydrolase
MREDVPATEAADPAWPPFEAVVRPEWVDYNGHMNVAYYVLVFDQATDAALDRIGIGTAYRVATGHSVFVVEAHVTYDREVVAGEPLAVASRILGFDGKRLILFHEMTCLLRPGLVASNEVLCLNVDLETRRTAPIDPAIRAVVAGLAARHALLPAPTRAGRAIRLAARRPD